MTIFQFVITQLDSFENLDKFLGELGEVYQNGAAGFDLRITVYKSHRDTYIARCTQAQNDAAAITQRKLRAETALTTAILALSSPPPAPENLPDIMKQITDAQASKSVIETELSQCEATLRDHQNSLAQTESRIMREEHAKSKYILTGVRKSMTKKVRQLCQEQIQYIIADAPKSFDRPNTEIDVEQIGVDTVSVLAYNKMTLSQMLFDHFPDLESTGIPTLLNEMKEIRAEDAYLANRKKIFSILAVLNSAISLVMSHGDFECLTGDRQEARRAQLQQVQDAVRQDVKDKLVRLCDTLRDSLVRLFKAKLYPNFQHAYVSTVLKHFRDHNQMSNKQYNANVYRYQLEGKLAYVSASPKYKARIPWNQQLSQPVTTLLSAFLASEIHKGLKKLASDIDTLAQETLDSYHNKVSAFLTAAATEQVSQIPESHGDDLESLSTSMTAAEKKLETQINGAITKDLPQSVVDTLGDQLAQIFVTNPSNVVTGSGSMESIKKLVIPVVNQSAPVTFARLETTAINALTVAFSGIKNAKVNEVDNMVALNAQSHERVLLATSYEGDPARQLMYSRLHEIQGKIQTLVEQFQARTPAITSQLGGNTWATA